MRSLAGGPNIVSGNLASLVGDHPHSISAWVKADQLNGDGLFHVEPREGRSDAASRLGSWTTHISWGGKTLFLDAEWHNMACTYNGGSDKKRIDGRHVGTVRNEDTFGECRVKMTDYRHYGCVASA